MIIIRTLVKVVPDNQKHFLPWTQGNFHNFLMLRLYNLFISVKILLKTTAEQQKSTTKGHFLYFRVQKRTFLLTGVL